MMVSHGKYVLRYFDDQSRGLHSGVNIENLDTWNHLVFRL